MKTTKITQTANVICEIGAWTFGVVSVILGAVVVYGLSTIVQAMCNNYWY